jgi:hypothetical protein
MDQGDITTDEDRSRDGLLGMIVAAALMVEMSVLAERHGAALSMSLSIALALLSLAMSRRWRGRAWAFRHIGLSLIGVSL